jgi:hypothetical protein
LQYFLSKKYSRRNYSSTWCTHKHVIIFFHNELTTNLQSRIFPCHVCVQLINLFPNICWPQSLDGYKNRFVLQHHKHIWWDIIDKGIAFFIIHVCVLLSYCFLTNLCYCSVLYIIYGHYSPIVRAPIKGISCNIIEEGMVSNIIHVCDMSFDFSLGNLFYCSVLIMVQVDFLGVLAVVS